MQEATNMVPRARKEIKPTPKQEARFWAKVNKDGPLPDQDKYKGLEQCWVWTTYRDKSGYGKVTVCRQTLAAHRVAYLISKGNIPHNGSFHGICVLHRCDNPSCVNPDHLFPGTQGDNNRDKENKGRGNQPRGDKNGARLFPERMARGEANGRSKLSAKQVIEMRAIFALGGTSQAQLGLRYGVNQAGVSRVIHRKVWQHV